MLYPLSYEGLRPTSYLPGRSRECPGVPSGAQRCRLVARWGFLRWSERVRSKFRAPAAGVPGGDHGCAAVMSGAIRSPGKSGALAASPELAKCIWRTT